MNHVRRAAAVLSLSAIAFVGPAVAAVEDEAGGRVPPDMAPGTNPSEYRIPPVNPSSLKAVGDHPWAKKTVRNLRGETLGTIDHVMIDARSGKEMYAMLKMGDQMQPTPVPLNYFKEAETGLILNASKDQLEPGGPNLGGKTKSQDFEHMGSEPLNPTTRQGGG